jgi:hypothetical protein
MSAIQILTTQSRSLSPNTQRLSRRTQSNRIHSSLNFADGSKVKLSNGSEKLTIELIANFPNFISNPPPPGNVRGSNPFDLVAVGDQLYITDGGQNSV